MNQLPKGLIVLAGLCWLALVTEAAWLGLHHGVNHGPHSAISAFVTVTATSLLVAATGLAALIWVLLFFASPSRGWRWTGLVASVLAIVAPWIAPWVLIQATTLSERRGFEQAGPQQLRQAAVELVRSSSSKDYLVRRFGREVPASDVPKVIRDFIPKPICVTVDEHGIVVVTDTPGQGGGYRIIPAGSDHIPQRSRRIDDGFYYVNLATRG